MGTRPGSRRRYVPERGDLVWLTFDPQAGHEQAGRRPALVISPATYNAKAGLALFVPITNQVKGYPFEVQIPADLSVSGVILADQLKSLDWRARDAKRITHVSADTLDQVLKRVVLLVSPGA